MDTWIDGLIDRRDGLIDRWIEDSLKGTLIDR